MGVTEALETEWTGTLKHVVKAQHPFKYKNWWYFIHLCCVDPESPARPLVSVANGHLKHYKTLLQKLYFVMTPYIEHVNS